MYFSKKNMIRLFSLIAIVILMTTLFAGCKKEDTAPTTEGEIDLNINLETEGQTQSSETEPTEVETEPVVNKKSATVTSQLNVRSAPSTNGSTPVGTLKAGDKVIVEERYSVTGVEWGYISSPMTGWICMDYVEMDYPDASTDSTTPGATAPSTPNDSSSGNDNSQGSATSTKGVVTTGLNIRKEPSTTSAVVGTYAKGDVVTIVEKRGEWGRTNKGWIKLEYVNTTGTTTGNGGNGGNGNTTGNGGNNGVTGNGSTTVILRGVVRVKDLNIRTTGSTNGTRVGSYTYGNRVEILEKDGNWGRTEKGWICLDYVYQDGTTGTNTASGTVTGNGLNIRSGPGTGYASVGSLNKGDRVNILEQFTYNGTTWGCIKNGWISMDFVDVDGGNSGGTSNDSDDDDESFGATVTGNGVNIRSGPGTGYGVVGTLNKGDRITIITRQVVNGTEWGKTSEGWVCMDFVKVN